MRINLEISELQAFIAVAEKSSFKAAAESQGAEFVSIAHLASAPLNRAAAEGHFQHSGVNWHPGDRGMAAIADTLWAHMRAMFRAS